MNIRMLVFPGGVDEIYIYFFLYPHCEERTSSKKYKYFVPS